MITQVKSMLPLLIVIGTIFMVITYQFYTHSEKVKNFQAYLNRSVETAIDTKEQRLLQEQQLEFKKIEVILKNYKQKEQGK